MKKSRVLILLLAILILPCVLLLACNGNSDDAESCADGHNWRNANNTNRHPIVQDRTCTLPEIRERECRDCGFTEEYISDEPAGHRYDSTAKVYLNDATCTEDGHYELHCYWYDRCGYVAAKREVAENTATGHTFIFYTPTEEDPTLGIAKCIDCDATDTKLIGITLDMEGDRSHLSYQAMKIYTADVANASEFKTVGENTYLQITRPAAGEYLGGSEFGVNVSVNASALKGKPYVVEAVLYLDEAKSGNVSIIGKKASLSQFMTFATYNSETGTIDSIEGAVYALDADDYANGIKIALAIYDDRNWYQIYVNDELVTGTVSFKQDYFAGIDIASFEIVALGTGETVFGIDNINIYSIEAGEAPDGVEDGATNVGYTSVELLDGSKLSVKLGSDECEHTSYIDTVVAPTCTTSGYTLRTCDSCGGQEIVGDQVAATGHANDDGIIVPATCFEASYKVKTCASCGCKTAEVVSPALGHKHGDDAEVTPATCKVGKITKGNCVECGVYFETIDKQTLEHELGDYFTVVNPTCSEDGYTTGPCKLCGEDYIPEDSIVGAFGHYYFEVDEHIEASCGNYGCDKYTCLSCGGTFEDNKVESDGHTTFTKTEVVSGKTNVTISCINCSYSFKYVVTGVAPDYNSMVTTLGSTLLDRAYAVADSGGKMMTAGGDYTTTTNTFKNIEWRNETDSDGNSFGRIVMNPTGSDGFQDFAGGTYGNNGGIFIWEFDAKHPTADELAELGSGFVVGGLIVGFRATDGAAIRINPTGEIQTRKDEDSGYNITGEKHASISSDKWTKIAVAVNFDEFTYTLYIDGSEIITVSMSQATIKNQSSSRGTQGARIGVAGARNEKGVGVIDIRNIYVYQADRPVFLNAPAEIVDISNTSFLATAEGNKLSEDNYLTNIHGSFGVQLKQNFKPTLLNNKLFIEYGSNVTSSAVAGLGTDSSIYADVAELARGTFTLSAEVEFKSTVGGYDIVSFYKEENALTKLIYINNGEICILGSDYTRKLGVDETVAFDVIVTNGKIADIYVGGILIIEGLELPDGMTTLKMFNITAPELSMNLAVNRIAIYEKAVIPPYYIGRLANHKSDGYTDEAISFTGEEKIADILPLNTKLPGGYYYGVIEDGSYLSISKVPETQKIIAGLAYVKLSGNGTVGNEGFNVLGCGDFKTNGVENISLGLGDIAINEITAGYMLGGYDSVTVRFYVNDRTAGFKFSIRLVCENGYYVIAEDSFSTGWHVETFKLSELAKSGTPDINDVDEFAVVFSDKNLGVNGNANVDGFSFYLENVSFKVASSELDNTTYIFKPHVMVNCGESHYYGAYTEYPATCYGIGYTTKVCEDCDYLDVEIIEKLEHSFTKVEGAGSEATCENDGVAIYECTADGCGMYKKEITAKLGHSFVLKEDATAADGKVDATCTFGGVDVYVCENESCEYAGKNFLMTTSPIGHAKAEDATETVIKPAGCLTAGIVEISECANCGGSYQVVVDKLGHDFREVIEAATCVTDGRTYEKCANCGEIRNEVIIEKLGHKAPGVYLHERVEQTCLNAKGWKYTCTVCGENGYIADEGEAPRPHSWGEIKVLLVATCGENGFRDTTCEECGGKMSEIGTDAEKESCVIKATGNHTFETEWTFSDDYVDGLRGERWHKCSEVRCDAILEAELEGAGSIGIRFEYNNAGAYVIVDYVGSEKSVVIPAMYKGMPVIIGNGFRGNTQIKTVSIADGVKIGSGAFEGCTALVSVELPEDIKRIPSNAFSGCVALRTVVIPESCSVIEVGAFYGCASLEKVVICGVLEEVQQFAFDGCVALTTVQYTGIAVPYDIIAEKGNSALLAAKWEIVA